MAPDTSQQQINGKTVKGPQDTEKQFVALGKAEINWPLNKLLHLLAWLLKIRFSKMCLIYTYTHTLQQSTLSPQSQNLALVFNK